MSIVRDEDGAIVGAVDLFHYRDGETTADYIRTIYDVERNAAGEPVVHLIEGDPEGGAYSVFPSYGPDNVVCPTRQEQGPKGGTA